MCAQEIISLFIYTHLCDLLAMPIGVSCNSNNIGEMKWRIMLQGLYGNKKQTHLLSINLFKAM